MFKQNDRICRLWLFLLAACACLTTANAPNAAIPQQPPPPQFPTYTPIRPWPTLPEGFQFGPVSAVATDSTDNVFIFHRGKNPVMVFDKDGKFLRSWGDEHFKSPHGLRIDKDNNVWTTDTGFHQVMKFDPNGKLLLSLGLKGQPGDAPEKFDRPTDIAVTAGGDFYVSDGYGNSRVLKFSRDGKLLNHWGKKGKGPGEFNLPHAICVDDEGKVYVGDRDNGRIQVFDANGQFLSQTKTGGWPYGMFLTKSGQLFVADGWTNRIRVLDKDFKELGRWGGAGKRPGEFAMPHMLCVDSQGAVYIAEVDNLRIQKFLPK
jgi:DNA-binding beta-propeller fold protein YncE